jgi:hypothetical protein
MPNYRDDLADGPDNDPKQYTRGVDRKPEGGKSPEENRHFDAGQMLHTERNRKGSPPTEGESLERENTGKDEAA